MVVQDKLLTQPIALVIGATLVVFMFMQEVNHRSYHTTIRNDGQGSSADNRICTKALVDSLQTLITAQQAQIVELQTSVRVAQIIPAGIVPSSTAVPAVQAAGTAVPAVQTAADLISAARTSQVPGLKIAGKDHNKGGVQLNGYSGILLGGSQERDHPATTVFGRTCSPAIKSAQAKEFTEMISWVKKSQQGGSGWGWSPGCWGEESVLPVLHKLSPAKNKVYVDIGANKGQSLATVYSLWTDLGFHHVMDLTEKGAACYFERTVPTVYALEPQQANIGLLNALKSKMPKKVQEKLFVENVAVVEKTVPEGVCMKGDTAAGSERAEVNSGVKAGKCAGWVVPGKSVDDWVAEKGVALAHIDYMKIDTEGHDMFAIRGAGQTLKAGKIDLLSFEYHAIGFWSSNTLEAIVKFLDAHNMDTYFIGDFYLFKLNGGCWDAAYEIKMWSNVLAIRRGWPLHAALLEQFASASCSNRDLAHVCVRNANAAKSGLDALLRKHSG